MQEFSGLDYVKIDTANHFGLDKEQFEDRIKWVDDQLQMGSFPSLVGLMDVAEDPFRYMAGVQALEAAFNRKATGHLCGMDACASGLQIMAALTGCHTTARNTGLIGQKRADIYTKTTKTMTGLLGANVEVLRPKVKKAQMTHFYGSVKTPRDTFGKDTEELKAFYKANKIVAPGACELMDLLLNSWHPWALFHEWDMADGFFAHVKVMQPVDSIIEVDEADHTTFTYRHDENIGMEQGLSLAANITHGCDALVVREICRRCNYDKVQIALVLRFIEAELKHRIMFKFHQGNVPRIERLATEHTFYSLVAVEHIDFDTVDQFGTEYLERIRLLLIDTLKHKSFPVVTIHDEFKAHANNMNRVRSTYIDIFAEMADSTMLQAILTRLAGKEILIDKYSNDLAKEIRLGNYGIC